MYHRDWLEYIERPSSCPVHVKGLATKAGGWHHRLGTTDDEGRKEGWVGTLVLSPGGHGRWRLMSMDNGKNVLTG